MKILVLDILIKQGKDSHQISKSVLERIFQEYQRLAELEDGGAKAIKAYLKDHNGKKMAGSEVNNIFKYQLNAGDRILYTYGKTLPYIREEDRDSLVLLGYAKHDDQGFFAKNKDFAGNHYYQSIKKIISSIEELKVEGEQFTPEDLIEINDILSGDYIQGHTLSVVPDSVLATTELENLDKYLSDEQNRCITDFSIKPQPTLILGGAGTGKTLVAIHMLNNFRLNNPGGKAVYFTQSKELLQRAKTLYKAAKGDDVEDNIVSFLDINDYCISLLGKERRDFVRFRQFEQFITDNHEVKQLCDTNDLDAIDVWAEIRGTIKGGMYSPLGSELGRQWSRLQTIDQKCFSNTAALVRKEYFKRSDDNKQRITLNIGLKYAQEKASSDESLTSGQRDDLKKAIEYFSGFDANISMVPKDDYYRIPDEYSIIPEEKRDLIWQICKLYDDHLRNSHLYDDNDLSRELQRNIDNLEKFDLVVVDEIQDYTEMQISLLANLCQTGSRIAFAGDEHQNVNPTVFNERRVESLFLEKKQNLKTIYLRKNFRCQQYVVDVANTIAELRRNCIGSKGKESEQPGTSERIETKPYRLEYSIDNIRKLANVVSVYPGAVLLVPDLATKDSLIKIIGEREYKENDRNYVFAVSEIKGMEYEYVVCCDLIARHIKTWEAIFEEQKAKHNTRYRFFFNLLYVGITRTQNHLCMLDSVLSEQLEEKLNIDQVEVFDPEKLYFDRLSARLEDWIRVAKQYESNEKYVEAIQNYRRGQAPVEDIYRCEMKRAALDNEFDIASKYAMLIGNYEEACTYADEIDELETLGALARVLAEKQIYNKDFNNTYGEMNEIIENNFMGFDDEEVDMIKIAAIKAIGAGLRNNAETIAIMAGE